MAGTSFRTCAVAVLVCAPLLACRGSRDPILDLLKELQQAAEARDASRIEANLAEDFQGSGRTSRQEAAAELKRYFALYETVKLDIYEVSVERGDETARLRFRVDFSGRPLHIGALAGFLPPGAMYRFDLGLKREGKRWRVASAEWEELAPSVPGAGTSP